MTLRTAQPPDHAAEPDWGISEALAHERASRVSRVRYDVALSVPPTIQAPLAGRVSIAFDLQAVSGPLTLDFSAAANALRAVEVKGQAVDVRQVNGHLVLPASALVVGDNVVTLTFDVGEGPLNRTDDFLYTILVPARAHELLPCFDQPDLKARWTLSVEVPEGWQVLGNGAETSCESRDHRTQFTFAETPPLSTYLFAVAAGRLAVEHATCGGRRFRIFHREADSGDLMRNLEVIADLQVAALDWLEQYTSIPHPFPKLDLLLVPAFQFGGMEHPGAIFYNAASVLLDAAATENQRLERAALIAHETAHLWFGDLVTMSWFSDVWVKEVFANLMAGKILASFFPDVNHDLRFLHAHYPPAYEIDRTNGTNAIRQPLANLAEAGALYGAVIYHKAPIVMRQLEIALGAEAFREGLRQYLQRYAFGHASWQDLVALFDGSATGPVSEWSRAWIDDAGCPVIETELQIENGRIARLALVDATRRAGHAWNQQLEVALSYPDRVQFIPAYLDREVVDLLAARGLHAPAAVLPNGRGAAYGAFHLDRDSLEWLLEDLPSLDDPLVRGVAWLTLWEAVLESDTGPGRWIDLAVRALPRETDELNVQRVFAYLEQTYWRFLSPRRRVAVAPRVERALIDLLHQSAAVTLKSATFKVLRNVALTPSTLAWLTGVWRREEEVPGLAFAESDEIALALELGARAVPDSEALLTAQIARTVNTDRRLRLEFVRSALSAQRAVRDAFFASLREASNRRHEAWVIDGVRYLHHPLRADDGVSYIRPSLDLLLDIQRTGDIFFPKRWVDATLSGHQSVAAADEVRAFLDRLPSGYPDRLRRMVVASADLLFRAPQIVARG